LGTRALDSFASGKFIVDSDPLTGGVNNFNAPWELPEQQCQLLQNIDNDDPTRQKKRDGYVTIGIGTTGIDASLLTKRISGMAQFTPSTDSTRLVIAISAGGTGKVYSTPDPEVTDWVEHKVDGVTSFDGLSDDVPMFQANNRLWFLPDGGLNVHTLAPDGKLTDAGNTNTSAPRGAVDGAFIGNRVWLISEDKGYFSDVLPKSGLATFDREVNAIDLSPLRNSKPIAARAWRSNSQVRSGNSLIVFYEDSITEVLINVLVPLNSSARLISPEYGCGSRDSIAVIGDEMYFMDQYGEFRSLQLTALAESQGVRVDPLSHTIKEEFPNNLNVNQLSKVRTQLLRDQVQVYYPRGAQTEAQARMIWDTPRRAWSGPDTFAHPFSKIIRTKVRGRGWEVFAANGDTDSPTPTVYRFGAGTYTDAGTAITAKIRYRAFGANSWETEKNWRWLERDASGDIASQWVARYRNDQVSAFTALTPHTGLTGTTGSLNEIVQKAAGSDFPLVPTDFPLLPADFPLTFVPQPISRVMYHLDSDGVTPSRFLELEFEDSTSGLASVFHGFRLLAEIEPFEREDQ
jgi:hypothetical protein